MAERPEDLSLPASVVARIIKDALPEGVNVSKEARTAIGKAASVFILYATACANNSALKNKRKTLSANDVFSALEDMEFEEFIPELKECLEVYKMEQRGRKEAAADRKKKAASSSASTAASAGPVAMQSSSLTGVLPEAMDMDTVPLAPPTAHAPAVVPHITHTTPVSNPSV